MELNNDGFIDNTVDADSATTDRTLETDSDSGEPSDPQPVATAPADTPVSDSLGDGDSLPSKDAVSDDTTAFPILPETDMSVSEETQVPTDYLSELEYIDYLLNTQLATMQSTISGNSINVTLDSGSTQLLTDISTKQDSMITNQTLLLSLTTCLIVVFLFDFMFHSARRVIKGMFAKKGGT